MARNRNKPAAKPAAPKNTAPAVNGTTTPSMPPVEAKPAATGPSDSVLVQSVMEPLDYKYLHALIESAYPGQQASTTLQLFFEYVDKLEGALPKITAALIHQGVYAKRLWVLATGSNVGEVMEAVLRKAISIIDQSAVTESEEAARAAKAARLEEEATKEPALAALVRDGEEEIEITDQADQDSSGAGEGVDTITPPTTGGANTTQQLEEQTKTSGNAPAGAGEGVNTSN